MLSKNNNPWLGLASYSYEDAYRFFGRENELEKLKDCICNNLITTIYGISGSGKTSFINAGMCPRIEKEGFLPVPIRLDHNSAKTYSQQIIKAVTETIAKVGGEIETTYQLASIEKIPESEKLWSFFYTSSFWSATNHHLYPVVFIDQFEEIFTQNDNETKVKDFFDSVSSLQYDNPPATITRILEAEDQHTRLNITQDFRIVLIMREDFLARFEDYSYDSPALRKNRVAIKRMNGNQSLEVITRPFPGLISREVALKIIARVAGRELKDTPAFLEKLSVDTSLLSLFCSELYLKASELKHSTITSELIDQFGEDILSMFYSNTMKLVSQQTSDYLEIHLLTRSGFRNAVAMEDILADGIHKEDLDKLCGKRLIRIETSEGTERVEFTHDVLCAIAKEHRDKLIKKSNRKQSTTRIVGFLLDLALPLLFLMHLSVFVYSNNYFEELSDRGNIYPFYITCTLILLFNVFILLPYRYSKDRNAAFTSFIALLGNLIVYALLLGTTTNENTRFGFGIAGVYFIYLLIQFLYCFRFDRKRSFKNALGYVLHCRIYKDHPEMLTLVKIVFIVLILFISIIVGLSMNMKTALITTPLCSIACFWLLCNMLGKTTGFNWKALLVSLIQAALIIVILATQFCFHHLWYTLLSLAGLLALTAVYLQNDDLWASLFIRIRNIVIIWALAFVLIPSVSLGYNLFNNTQYRRISEGEINNYQMLRFLIVEDVNHKQGVRGRWDIIVPVEYDSIKNTVYINFNEESTRGLMSFEQYDSPFANNDIVFTTYHNNSEEFWHYSGH